MIVNRGELTRFGAVIAALSSLAIAFAVMFVTAAPASAHAHLVKIDPADKAVLATPLTTVTLTFDENMREPAAIVVTDPSGARVDKGAAQVVDKIATAELQVDDPGRYTIAYRVVSADGHPVTGQTTFTYRPPASPTSTAGGSPSAAAAARGTTAKADPHAGHPEQQGGSSNGWIMGSVAGLALIGGFVLLAQRRRGLGTASTATGEDAV